MDAMCRAYSSVSCCDDVDLAAGPAEVVARSTRQAKHARLADFEDPFGDDLQLFVFGRQSVRCLQPAHSEFDGTVRQVAPVFDFAHVGSLGILLQKRSRLRTSFFARKSKRLAHETVRSTRSTGHTVGNVPRS